MPARSYRYYEVNEFPELEPGETLTTTHQGTLLPGMVDEAPQTIVRCLGIADYETYSKYHVSHETRQAVTGRYMNQPIHSYIREVEFHLFRDANRDVLFIDTNKQVCREMLRRLRDSETPLDLVANEIDLSKVSAALKSSVSGGWFGDLRIADVSSMAAFGAGVGDSSEWDRLDNLGKLRVLDVRYEYQDELHSLAIMPDRSVILFAPFTEREALQLLENIQRFLDSYATPSQ